ncbi:hypothetical protein ICC18_12285 [Paenibacillus sp. WST5]|uniref:Uncharacterized protein n=1 Tax=Paenibacillus sedimenti TaxID=2770274 RepID=A0A926KRU1_9BACL|nr:hypothetical protein [Paenibacillus sedimenti]
MKIIVAACDSNGRDICNDVKHQLQATHSADNRPYNTCNKGKPLGHPKHILSYLLKRAAV